VFSFRLPVDRGRRALEKQYPEDPNWSQQKKFEHSSFIMHEANKLEIWTFIISEFAKHDQPLEPTAVEDLLRLVQAMMRGKYSMLFRKCQVEFREFFGSHPHVQNLCTLDDAGNFTVS
jgi:hypothetical protein